MIRVAGGQGMYGDHAGSVRGILEAGVDYLCLEALAELTLAILQKDRQKDPNAGFTKDLPIYLGLAAPWIAKRRTKVITNAGGINVDGAMKLALKLARDAGLKGLKIASVTGDDVSGSLDAFRAGGEPLDGKRSICLT